ncbi:MAG: NOP5/NOP56 family protein, partial [Candidatus Thermoplasmatota archaeon]|nr:NOP5/NOP56 family protein [Candidatus Thermoplasmatota archaeon]
MGTPTLVTTWFGAFLVDGDEVIEERLFPTVSEVIADRLEALGDGEVLDEERTVAERVEAVHVTSRRLLKLPNASTGPPATLPLGPEPYNFSEKLLKEATTILTRRRIRQGLAEEPRHLMQAISYLDESFEVENLLGERLVAWLTYHAPEVVQATGDHVQLARKVLAHEDLEDLLAGEKVTDTLGAPWAEKEGQALHGLAQALIDQVEARSSLEGFITDLTKTMAPNLSTVVGATIAARLIHHAGGLKELARSPSSTLQTLGAEKALFRHFTEGAPPPKHGVIYQHPLVHRSHPKDRGSISRALAAKATIAARA